MFSLIKKTVDFIENNKFTSFFVNRDNFALLYTFSAMLYSVPLLIDKIDIVNKFMFIWGFGLICWDLISKRRIFRMVYWVFPILLLGSYAISILLNLDAGIYNFVKLFIYTSITLLVLYCQDRRATKEKILALLRRLCYAITGFSTVTGLASLVLYAKGAYFTVTTASGDVIRQGFTENRLFGVYYSPNVCALVVVVSFAAILINLLINKKSIFNYAFCGLNFVINFVCFSLTLSRGGALTLIALAGLCVIFAVAPVAVEKKGVIKGGVITVVVAAIIFGGGFAGVKGCRAVMSFVPAFVAQIEAAQEEETTLPEETTVEEQITETVTQEAATEEVTSEEQPSAEETTVADEKQTEESSEPVTEEKETLEQVDFERIEDMADISNGRIVNWTGALKILKQSPLFGFGDYIVGENAENANYDLSELTPQEKQWAFYTKGNLHNGYMQILMFSGIIGFLIFVVFAGFVILKLLKTMFYGRKDTQLYKVIAVMFSMLGAFAVNAMIESHLLFRRQNMFACVFWLFIGIAVVIAEIYRHSEEYKTEKQKNNEDFAFIVASPLQAINSVNLVVNDIEGSKNNSDAFVYHMFKNSEQLSEKLKASGVFNNVYDIRDYAVYPRLLNYIVTFFRMFCPKITLWYNSDKSFAFGKKDYKVLAMSTTLGFTGTMHFAYPRAEVMFFEDGTGSYCSDFSERYSKLFDLVDFLLFNGDMHIKPERIYLFRPEFLTVTLDYEVRKMPDIAGSEVQGIIERIFDYKQNTLYRDCECVYLTQPRSDEKGFNAENLDKVLTLLTDVFGSNTLARVHPRDDADKYGMLTVDSFNNSWELECLRQITDRNILMGVFSTAQIMPKILSESEPTLIFIYKLIFTNCDEPVWQERRKFMDDFTKHYRNKERIFIPETIEDLRDILISLKGN